MGKAKKRALTAASVTAVFFFTGLLCPMVYYLNDDTAIRSVLSGAYTGTPDGHAVYLKYPLAGLLSLLYRLAGSVPWYSLFLAGCFVLGSALVLSCFSESLEEKGFVGAAMLCCMAFLCAALFLPHFIYLHYTIVAALLGGCGLFLAVCGSGPGAVALFFLCYCLRSQVFFLLLPFWGVACLWRLTEGGLPGRRGRKEWVQKLKSLGVPVLSCACGVLACMAVHAWMYRSLDWQEYLSYNDARTQLYDYRGLLAYEENQEAYGQAGIDRMRYDVLDQYALALDDGLEAGQLAAAAQMHEEAARGQESLAVRLKTCLVEYYYHFRVTDKPYNGILAAAYLLLAVLLVWRREWLHLGLAVCLGLGRSMIWLYLIWQGRFPERISVSLYFLEILLLCGMLCRSIGTGWKKAAAAVAASVICLALSVVLAVQMSGTLGRVEEQWKAQEKWEALTSYCEERKEDLYLLDVRSMVSYAGKVWEKGPDRENYLLAGGWMSRTPLMEGRFAELGAADGAEALARNGDVYYIAAPERSVAWLADYLRERYDAAGMEKVDEVALGDQVLFCVYRAKAGDEGTAKAGDAGMAKAGDAGMVKAGDAGVAKAGDAGMSKTGDAGMVKAEGAGTVKAGGTGEAKAEGAGN